MPYVETRTYAELKGLLVPPVTDLRPRPFSSSEVTLSTYSLYAEQMADGAATWQFRGR